MRTIKENKVKVGDLVSYTRDSQRVVCDDRGPDHWLTRGALAVVIALYPDEEEDRDMQLRDFDGRTHTWSSKLWSWELVDDQV